MISPTTAPHLSLEQRREQSRQSETSVWVAEPAAAQIVRIPRALLMQLADGGEVPFRMSGRVREFCLSDLDALRDRLLERAQQSRPERRAWFDPPRS